MLTFALRFDDLHREGHGYSFPCDKDGNVGTENTKAMTETMHRSYLFVLARVGLDYSTPHIISE